MSDIFNFQSTGVVFSPPGVHYLVNHPLNFDATNIGVNLSSFLLFLKKLIVQITRSPIGETIHVFVILTHISTVLHTHCALPLGTENKNGIFSAQFPSQSFLICQCPIQNI